MPKFNEEKFRADAKAAGYGEDEINAEVQIAKTPSGAAVPNIVPIADGRETTAAFQAEAKTVSEEIEKSAKQEQQKTLTEPKFDFMNALNSPVGYVTGAAALGALTYGTYVAGKKLGLFDRKISKPSVDRTIDIPMDTVEKRNVSPFAQQFETTYGVPLADAERLTGGPITNPKDAAIIGGALKNQGGISVNNPYQTSSYSQAPAPVAPTAGATTQNTAPAPVAPTPSSVQEGVQTGNTAKAVQSVLAQEIDKTAGMYRDAQGNMVYPEKMSLAARTGAEAFTKQYPDIAKTLEGKGQFAILGGGSGDNSLFNTYDSELMKRLRNEVNQGQMVGPDINYTSKINPAIQAISPESALGKELADLKATQPKGGTKGTLGIPATIGGVKGGLMKGPNQVRDIVKAGGPALLLMAMADAAKAAQQGKYGEAAVRSADVATDYVPMIAQLKQGFSPTEANAPGVSQQRIESSALLGSPYAQTEWAKNQRLKEKAGAGRGIAPPSAYMR